MITVTPVGLPDLTDLLYLLFQRHITHANLNPVREVGRASGRGGWWVDCEEVSAAVEEAWWRCCPDRDSFPRPNTRTLPRCALGSVASVTPQGEVFPCHVLTLPELPVGTSARMVGTELCSALDCQSIWRRFSPGRPRGRRGLRSPRADRRVHGGVIPGHRGRRPGPVTYWANWRAPAGAFSFIDEMCHWARHSTRGCGESPIGVASCRHLRMVRIAWLGSRQPVWWCL